MNMKTHMKTRTKTPRTAELLTTVPCQGVVLDLENGTVPFKKIQELVGGRVEAIYLKTGVLCVNEDGRSMRLPFNPDASELAGMVIVGDAVYLSHRKML
ncbi:MAG: hypothetical protein IAE94_09650 [Chthoniobacterales bacterium]|nr:hypothetical protein [Chthoniobacterales bacterium]